MIRTLRPLAAIAMVALLSAGCSRAAADDDSGNAKLQKALTFSQCMRTNGVGEFPDPNPSGNLTLAEVVNVSLLDPEAPAWKDAIAVCRHLQPAGFDISTAGRSDSRRS